MSRSLDLGILGAGAVSPMGWSVRALLEGVPAEARMATLSRPETRHQIYRVPMDAPEAGALQREPRLRRSSGISFFLAGASRQALAEAEALQGPLARERLGLIGLFHTGAVHYSRRFFEGARDQGKKFASPALFPETVYNSPLSHTAALLGIAGRAYSLVGDGSIWAGAFATAALWLDLGVVDAVLIAAAEELDPIALEAYQAAGWLDKQRGFIPSEGAAAVVVGRAEARARISWAEEGRGYHNARGAVEAGRKMLPDLEACPVARSAAGTWMEKVEFEVLGSRLCMDLPGCPPGEAFVASGGWHLLRAVSLEQALLLPLWGSNFQIAALCLEPGRLGKK